MAKSFVLVLGGARSGKTRFAQQLAQSISDDVLYVATAEALDEEMKDRIEMHRNDRPSHWRTLEAPTNIGEAISAEVGNAKVVLIDCLTLLASNLLGKGIEEKQLDIPRFEESINLELRELFDAYEKAKATFIVVSNEIGQGLVPVYPEARAYRDALGKAHQDLAKWADEVYFVTAGIPQILKKKSEDKPKKPLKLKKGLIQVYTGNGKGKTTAAIGLALRAAGRDLRVSIVQFLKANDRCGEHIFADRYKAFEIVQVTNLSAFKQNLNDRREVALRALELARDRLRSGTVDILILDEAITAVSAGGLLDADLEALMDEKPANVELVLTGRGASDRIIQRADLVTEMREIKHPFRNGIMARVGIEL